MLGTFLSEFSRSLSCILDLLGLIVLIEGIVAVLCGWFDGVPPAGLAIVKLFLFWAEVRQVSVDSCCY